MTTTQTYNEALKDPRARAEMEAVCDQWCAMANKAQDDECCDECGDNGVVFDEFVPFVGAVKMCEVCFEKTRGF
jgi:hypothetical protein